MQPEQVLQEETTLDPQDWESMRALGHRMLDEMFEYLQTVRERPVWQPVPKQIKEKLSQPLPHQPQPAEAVYQDFLDWVAPYPAGNIHPRFWGWVMGTGTPLGMLAEMLSGGMNTNAGGGDQSSTYVEWQVLDWCKEMVGYPQEASGVLVSGCSTANLLGLAVARNTQVGFEVRKQGLQAYPQRFRLYGSVEMHSSLQKAVELLGLGDESLRRIPVDDQYRIDVKALEAAIAADRAAGDQPICVIGCAGTVNTGGLDDLNALADLCQREGLWFHVDGAFGALAAISEKLRPLVAGIERADSIAFDLHKWMYMPFEMACVLVRNEADQRWSFSLTPEYLTHATRGFSAVPWFSDYGMQLSRGFRALKAWMSIKEHGLDRYSRQIEQNVEQARYLGRLVEENPQLELLAPITLNIVCFRYTVPGMDDSTLNELNQELLLRLSESGEFAPSSTQLDGKYAIRAAITNHRSRREDFDRLVEKVVELGTILEGEMQVGGPKVGA